MSFFQNRLIAQRRQFIVDANDEVEDRQEAARAKTSTHPSKMEGSVTRYISSIWRTNTTYLRWNRALPIPSDQIKLRVWEKPHPEGIYVIGVDPAGGRSEDSNHHCARCGGALPTRWFKSRSGPTVYLRPAIVHG